MNPLLTLEPVRVWTHFAQILAIPRASGAEQRIRSYCEQVARGHGWEAATDSVGNLCIRVPATPGLQGAPGLVLQAHLDMVCEKTPECLFDFERSAIVPALADGWVTASCTTLGADDGVGIAAALSLCEDIDVLHGPIEILLTVNEETTGIGAAQLDRQLVTFRTMLNLDSEDDTTLVVGCAGGCGTEMEFQGARGAPPDDFVAVKVAAAGLGGGHSGLSIHENRGNAIKILARVLQRMLAQRDLFASSLQGGNKPTAIAREAAAIVFVPAAFVLQVTEIAAAVRLEFVEQLHCTDPELRIDVNVLAGYSRDAFDCSATRRLVRLLAALPNGVQALSRDIPGCVETSTNLATVRTHDDRVVITSTSRSMSRSGLRGILDQIDATARLGGADAQEGDEYPPWRADPASQFLTVARDAYRAVRHADPAITAIHAGLECGLIHQRIAGMDMLSIGPLIRDAHTPSERVSVASVKRFYDLLCHLVARFART